MRKLIVVTFMSLDGFYEGPGKDVMALPMDVTFSEYNLERMKAADTVLLGADSYEGPVASGRSRRTTPRPRRATRSSPDSMTISKRSSSRITPRFHKRAIPGRARQGL